MRVPVTFSRTMLWITIFGVSMAFFESSIVVYLRALYYPEGFSFPLTPVGPHIGVTELIREFFSLVMIVSVAALSSRVFLLRFAHFLYIFAVWDIFYYVFLKMLLGWPASLLTWDILFLIPVAWSGPVITPLVISVIMILFALTLRYFISLSGYRMYMEPREWLFLLAGAVVIFFAFIWDYLQYLLSHLDRQAFEDLQAFWDKMQGVVYQYVPVDFNWTLFVGGLVLLLVSLMMIYRRNRKLWK